MACYVLDWQFVVGEKVSWVWDNEQAFIDADAQISRGGKIKMVQAWPFAEYPSLFALVFVQQLGNLSHSWRVFMENKLGTLRQRRKPSTIM